MCFHDNSSFLEIRRAKLQAVEQAELRSFGYEPLVMVTGLYQQAAPVFQAHPMQLYIQNVCYSLGRL